MIICQFTYSSPQPFRPQHHLRGTKKGLNVAQGCHTLCLGNDKSMKCRPRVPHDTLGEQLKHEMSPEGAARQCWGTTWGWNVALGDGRITGGLQDRFMEGSSATESCWNVAQGFRTARLGNDKGMKCRPRVSHDTLGNNKSMKCRPRVPHDTLGEQLRHETSPDGAARHPRVTFWGFNVALAPGRGQRLRLATSKCTLLPKRWKEERWWSRRSGRARR